MTNTLDSHPFLHTPCRLHMVTTPLAHEHNTVATALAYSLQNSSIGNIPADCLDLAIEVLTR